MKINIHKKRKLTCGKPNTFGDGVDKNQAPRFSPK
jgi:hypothetical protein